MAIYDKIKEVCSKKGITIFSLEKELGFARSSISKWNENIPSVTKVKAVAEHLGVPMEELVSEKEG